MVSVMSKRNDGAALTIAVWTEGADGSEVRARVITRADRDSSDIVTYAASRDEVLAQVSDWLDGLAHSPLSIFTQG